MHCPNCDAKLPIEAIDLQEDVNRCPSCYFTFRISEILDKEENRQTFRSLPKPRGFTGQRDDQTFTILVAPSSFLAIPILIFGLIWTTSMAFGVLPRFLIFFSGDAPWWSLVILVIAGILLLGAGIFFTIYALLYMMGKFRLKLDAKGGEAFTGIGSIGWKNRFNWKEIREIKEKVELTDNKLQEGFILLVGPDLKIGHIVTRKQRPYLAQLLEIILEERKLENPWPPDVLMDLLAKDDD